MFKLFYLFLTTSLLGSYKKQTILKPKLLFLNLLKFKPPQSTVLNFFSLILVFLLFATSCNTTNPIIEMELKLELKDISCTEAWLQLTTNNLQLPTTINLLKNNTVAQVFNLSTNDSLLYLDSLFPNQTYKILVAMQQSNNVSNEISFTTMDTTSHNFNWQIFEFGVITNQSRLFDVAIINENNIWAVGEIYTSDSYTYDSLGNWIDPYNAAHWNGSQWELKRIYYNYNGSNLWSPIRTILAFNANDIWFSAGIHWNGIDFTTKLMNIDFPYQINKMWGTSSNDFYIVGSSGSIAHYGGSSVGWKKIESGTSLILSDIAVNNNNEVHICGLNMTTVDGIIIRSNDGTNFNILVESDNIPPSQLFKPKLYGTISSICFDQSNTLYAAGNMVYQYKFNKWDYLKSLPENFIGGNPGTFYRGYVYKIRADASNDIWIAGDRNTLRHFNGISWQQIGMPYDPQIDLVWRGMTCKDNNTVVVGSHDRSAIIMMIKK